MEQAQLELLVLASQDGNTKAFECLFEHFHPLLIRFANNLCGNPALASDAVQDVWLNTSRSLRKLRDPRAFKSWLYRAVRWRVLDLKKAKAYLSESIDETELTQPLDESQITERELKRAIDQLADKERNVVYLFYLSELSISEIAAVLEIPSGTVKSRLSSARAKLKDLMQLDNLAS